ncbi:alpha/beta fold hydrolase [Streptomyces sp. L7]
MVLVHGYPDSKEVWSEVASRLADRFHVVLYDVRGHGRSTAPQPLRGGFTLEKLTDDFLAVADAVSPDRPVHLVGHDWGSVQSWESRHRRAHEGPYRLLHVDVRALPRPLRALDQQASDPAHPAPRRPTPGPGRQVLVRVPPAHARAARTRLARPARQTLAEDPGTRREGTPRRLPHLVASLDAAHGAWLYRDNVRARLRRPRRRRLRARARAAHHAPGGRVSLRAALRRAGGVGA